jgi:hypothetical protein
MANYADHPLIYWNNKVIRFSASGRKKITVKVSQGWVSGEGILFPLPKENNERMLEAIKAQALKQYI